MAQPPTVFVRNRILTALSAADAQRLRPCLEYVSLPLHQVLIEAHQPIEHVHFLESGLSSDTTTGDGGEMEVGMIGREGLDPLHSDYDCLADWSRVALGLG